MHNLRTESIVLASVLTLSACSFAPAGLEPERARARAFGAAYDVPFEERELPPLSARPEFAELWQRALSSHGELEAAWHEWRAALYDVVVASSAPNTNVSLDVAHALPNGGLDAWDRTTLRLGFDPMQNLWMPNKISAAGEAALARARAAGERFRSRRFALKRELAETWIDWLASDGDARLLREALDLDAIDVANRGSSVAGGAAGEVLVAARLAEARDTDEMARAEARRDARLAALNAMLARAPSTALAAPDAWPTRTLEESLARLDELARESDPSRAEQRASADAREHDVELAKLERQPDVNPFIGITGSIEKMIGAGISFPVNTERVRATIRAAREQLTAARSSSRQVALTRSGALAAAYRAWKDSDRASRFYREELLPLAARSVSNAEANFASGGSSSEAWIAARRAAIDVRRAELEARAARETELARIEELVGVDLEALPANVESRHE